MNPNDRLEEKPKKSKSLIAVIVGLGFFLIGFGVSIAFWILGHLKAIIDGDLTSIRLIARLLPKDKIDQAMTVTSRTPQGPITQQVELPEHLFLGLAVVAAMLVLIVSASLAKVLLTTGFRFVLWEWKSKKKKGRKAKQNAQSSEEDYSGFNMTPQVMDLGAGDDSGAESKAP